MQIKKALFCFSLIALVSVIVLIFANEGVDYSSRQILLREIEKVKTLEEYEGLKDGLVSTRNTLVKVTSDLAYDKESDTYYASNPEVSLKGDSKADIFLYQDDGKNLYQILAKSKDQYSEIKILVTNTPIIKIDKIKEKRKPMKRPHDRVIITALELDPQNKPQKYQIKMRPRGHSSLAYEKKSYTIRNLNKKPMSIYGLPMNEKYVLNSMYEDEYKIRDVLSWNIWTEASAYSNDRNLFNSTDMIYVEVFIDDSYEGMYGLQDYVNEYKLNLVESKGSIFKFRSWDYPSLENFDRNNEEWDGIEVSYSNLIDGQKWFGFEDYIEEFATLPLDPAFVEEKLDMESFIDYYVFSEFITARDNRWNNLFMSISAENNKLMVTPWDLDMTFGSVWTGDLPYLTKTDFEEMPELYAKADDPFFINRLVHHHKDFKKRAGQRYFQLREDLWSEEKILGKIQYYQNFLRDTGIYERDLTRWPSSPKITPGREDFISEFIVKKMDLLDEIYENVLSED